MKILIVDDKAENLYMLEALLKGNGYEVVSAADGKEALKRLRSEGADMIISDILMPVMDGFQLCLEVRADETLKYITFIFYTATYTDEKDEEFALKIGANKFLRKPMEPDEFIKIIQGLIRDVEEGKFRPQEPALRKTAETFELYSERLVKKLEKKMLDLEKQITGREWAEERVKHLNLVLRAIRKVNQLIIKEKDPDRLLQDVCDNLIENRGYYNAWIALLDETGGLVATAEAGLDKDFSAIVERLKKGEMIHCVKKARMQSEIVVTKDPLSSCTDCPLAKTYRGRAGFAGRLEHDGKMYGVLTVSIPGDFVADEEEQSVFGEIAGDISYALHNMELEKEQKQAEGELRKSEHRYRMLLENLPQKIFYKDRNLVYVSCNENYARDLKIKSEEITGKTDYEFYSKEIAEKYRTDDERIITLGKTEELEEKYMIDRQEMWVQTVKTPIEDEKGNVIGVLGIFWDITERKRAEEAKKKLEAQLQQGEKMEAIGTLAGGIAHDFNNILSAIIGYSELALEDAPKESLLQSNLQEVLEGGNRARDLIKQILAFSRQAEQELQPIQPKLIVKEVLKLLRASLPTTIEIKQNIQSDSSVQADPTQLHQVLMNLCTNAGYAMRETGGTLEVTLTDVELDPHFTARYPDMTPGPHIRLTVNDTGHGMTPEVRECIFDPFFTTKERGEGTGMGLSVAIGIVTSHGGTITVHSEPGMGSNFQVYLPLVEPGLDLELETEKPVLTGDERILFVDDEQPLAKLGKQILERLGYQVVISTSSVEALELFRAKADQFDLVITDMTMPNMTGHNLARELMKVRPDIPIILCTGFSERITVEKAKKIGIRELLLKPLSHRVLGNTVRKVLDESNVDRGMWNAE